MGREGIKERSARRLPVKTGCWLVGSDEASCYETFDLSICGVAVVTTAPLPVGKVVDLQFFTPLAAAPLTVTAEVVWSRLDPEGGMGLRFIDLDRKTEAIIKELVRKLEKGKRGT
jgi:hypothetical protein